MSRRPITRWVDANKKLPVRGDRFRPLPSSFPRGSSGRIDKNNSARQELARTPRKSCGDGPCVLCDQHSSVRKQSGDPCRLITSAASGTIGRSTSDTKTGIMDADVQFQERKKQRKKERRTVGTIHRSISKAWSIGKADGPSTYQMQLSIVG